MVKSPKVATPDTAATDVVPPRTAFLNRLASVARATSTLPVKAVATFPNASRAGTTTGARALPTTTATGCNVKNSCAASAGSTVTLGCCAMVTEPTVAVIVFTPATVELKVPVMIPLASVVPDGVRALPVPVDESFTGAPLTAFPGASSTVTVIVEALAPLLAVIGLGAAVVEDRLELGGAGVPVAVKVTGLGIIPVPDAVAVSEFGPARVPRVQVVAAAIPSTPVVMAVVGSTVPLFTMTANVTATPGTALSN